MKHFFRILFFLPIVLIITACPYESPVPITPPTKQMNQDLLGKWVKNDEYGSEYPSEYYQIKALDDTQYEVAKYSLQYQ